MSNTLSIATPSEGLGSDGGQSSPNPHLRRPAAEPAETPEAAPAPAADPGQRLIIEEVDGALVYTVIDRATGAVVARTSRDAVSQMGAKPDYAAGALIRTTA